MIENEKNQNRRLSGDTHRVGRYLHVLPVVLAFVTAAMMFHFAARQIAYLESAFENKLRSYSSMLRESLRSAVAFHDVETARESFNIIAQDADVRYLGVSQENGRVLHELGTTTTALSQFSLTEALAEVDDVARLVGPVVSLEGPRGTVVVELSRDQINDEVRATKTFASSMSAAALLLSLAIGWLVRSLRSTLLNVTQAQDDLLIAKEHERKRIEAKERETFRFLEQMPLAVCVVDDGGQPIFLNEKCKLMMGGDNDSSCLYKKRGIDDDYSPDDLPLARALRGESVDLDDLDLVHADARVPVSATAGPILDDDGNVQFGFVTYQNISEKLQLESERLQAQKLESVGRLAAGIAHEINTPMQYVGDNASFLDKVQGNLWDLIDYQEATILEHCADDLQKELKGKIRSLKIAYLRTRVPRAIGAVIEGADAVARLVGSMKEFSHPGEQRKIPTDINRAIETTVTVSRNEWKYFADLDMEFDPELPLVPVLRGELNQVILNLIVNSAHAISDVVEAGAKGTILIRTRCVGSDVEISIRDTGGGIPEKNRNRVFDPFFTTKEVGKGTGQGLAIAHSIVVEKHGGSLSFESVPDEGTTMFIRFPMTTDEEAVTDAAA